LHKSAEISELESQVSRIKSKFSGKIQLIVETHRKEINEISSEIMQLRADKKQLLEEQANAGVNTQKDDILKNSELNLAAALSAQHAAEALVEELQEELQHERAEASALRLRLDLQREALRSQGRSQPQALRSEAQVYGRTLREGSVMRLGNVDDRIDLNVQRFDQVASPQFSDDFGPASLPGSPLDRSGGKAILRRERSYSDSFQESVSLSPNNADGALVAENERLKNAIKDMRVDLEALQSQLLPIENYNTTGTLADRQKIEALESRLKQSSEEISRLRAERRRLMEVGTELRAELNQSRKEISERHLAREAGARVADPDSTARWRQRRSEPDSSESQSLATIDPWFLLPVRTERTLSSSDVGGYSSTKSASGGEEVAIEIAGNKTGMIGTVAGAKISRSVLMKGKAQTQGLARPGTKVVGVQSASSQAPPIQRKVMNYGRGGENIES
jgi:hypothetical protein